MAKLKAPLLSMGASGQLGKTLVYTPWKGLHNVRTYVIPSNPKSQPQMDQRGYLSAAVTYIHNAINDLNHPLNALDKSAYSLWAAVMGIIMTWFNAAIKNYVDQTKVGNIGVIYSAGLVTPGSLSLDIEIYGFSPTMPTAGDFWYGTSKSSMLQSQAATIVANKFSYTLSGLVANTNYYIQFRPTVPAGAIGAFSGIYHGRPTP